MKKQIPSSPWLLGSAIISATALLVVPSSSFALSATWNGTTSGAWSDTSNWVETPASVPGAADTATFNAASSNTTIDLGSGVTIKTLLFDTASVGSYTIGAGDVSAQTLTLASSGAITVNSTVTADQLINANVVLGSAVGASTIIVTNNSTTNSLTLAGEISTATTGTKTLSIKGTGSTIVSGNITDGVGQTIVSIGATGTATLSGSNSFSGGLTAKYLNIGNAYALGTGTVTISNGGSIDNTSGAALTIATNNVIVPGSFTFIGSNDLNMGTGDVAIGATHDTFTINAGTLTFGGNFLDGGGTGSSATYFIKAGSGTLVITGNLYCLGSSSVGTSSGVYAGKLVLAGDNTAATGGISVYNGELDINSNTAVSGTLKIVNTAVLDNTSGSAVVLTTNPVQIWSYSFTYNGTNDLNLGTGTVSITTPVVVTTSGTGALTVGGAISSSYGLTKAGTGKLVLTGTSSYAGATTVNAGVLSVAMMVNGGSNSSIGAASSIAGNLVLNGGTLQYTGGDTTTDRLFTTGSNGATLDASGSGAIQFTNTGSIAMGGTSQRILTLTGDNSGDNTLAAVIGNGTSGTTSLIKSGSGRWILTGNETYTGDTTISEGELDINGSLAAGSAVSVTGATLGGSGQINGSVSVASGTINGSGLSLGATTLSGSSTLSGINTANSVTVASGTTMLTGTTTSANALTVSTGAVLNNNGVVNGNMSVSGLLKGSGTLNGNLALSGTLAPGNSPGITTINGDLTMDVSAVLAMEVAGTSAGTTYDQIKVSGNITLAGTLDLSTLSGLTLGDTITLIDNTGTTTTTSGYFTEIITSGSTYTISGSSSTYLIMVSGTEYLLNYAASVDGDSVDNDMTLTVVPEPSTWMIMAVGLGMLLGFQRMHRRNVNI